LEEYSGEGYRGECEASAHEPIFHASANALQVGAKGLG
jgi:hypothetical protein